MTREMVSIPEGMCSKDMPFTSITESSLLPYPTIAFMRAFSIVMTVKSFLPAIPVIVPVWVTGPAS